MAFTTEYKTCFSLPYQRYGLCEVKQFDFLTCLPAYSLKDLIILTVRDCSIITPMYTAMQSKKAVSAYFTSKQILPFGLAEQYTTEAVLHYSSTIVSLQYDGMQCRRLQGFAILVEHYVIS